MKLNGRTEIESCEPLYIMEKQNVIAAAATGNRMATADRNEENGCDCTHSSPVDSHYVDHHCGYKRQYPHR